MLTRTSALATIAGLMAQPAYSEENSATLGYFAIGAAGVDAYDPSIGASTLSTPGRDGGPLNASITRDLAGSLDVHTPTVNMTANGGRGGNGDYSAFGAGDPPSPGGRGGSVSFSNSGTITAVNLYPGSPVVQLMARGGAGGFIEATLPGAHGGDGGTVSYSNAISNSLPGSIVFAAPAPTGPVFDYATMPSALLNADASGGNSGFTGYYRTVYGSTAATNTFAGGGGRVTVDLTSGLFSLTRPAPADWMYAAGASIPQFVPTSAAASPAYIVSGMANGGAGTSGFGIRPTPGGLGGAGGTVTIRLNPSNTSVVGSGDAVVAILASANGGNGGNGYGSNDIASSGGNGGAAGTAIVSLGMGTLVSTTGASAPAIVAEAFGGVGASSSGTQREVSLLGNYGRGDNVGFGGNGGNAGHGDGSPTISISAAGQVYTMGDVSPGIIALATGGPGGNSARSGTRLIGGDGGSGGVVSVSNSGLIGTGGSRASGVVALSAGGTGGNGSNSAQFASGGDGGQGGVGGAVTVTNALGATIRTAGDYSIGILAESLGGGASPNLFGSDQFAPHIAIPGAQGAADGGTGSFLFWSVGGDGGAAGAGGAVTVTQSGVVRTEGSNAPAILAQSIGGSGGAGGNSKTLGLFFAIATGGSGGAGADGGPVLVNGTDVQGIITTNGVSSPGILAQSIGGNGGLGGSADATALGAVASIAVAVGGSGGAGGNGGAVEVQNGSAITTAGQDSPGVVAQSIGGGGGTGGQASSVAVAVEVPEFPAIAMSVAVGGSGNAGGSGGAVRVTSNEAITTAGEQSPGIKALSIGGGGGDAGNANSVSNMIGFTANIGVSVAVGGSGAAAGAGGTVDVTNNGEITTAGAFAHGIVAGSVGGGGGSGGTGTSAAGVGLPVVLGDLGNMAFTYIVPMANSITVNVGVGGSGGAGGSGGDVSVTNNAPVSTAGSQAHGIFAQSIGGGGGFAGGYSGGGTGTLAATVNVGGVGGVGGNGGRVTVTNAAGVTIRTEGVAAHGIYAQSVGGGGGAGGTFTTDTGSSTDDRWNTAKQIVKEGLKAYKYSPDDIKAALKDGAKRLSKATVDTLKSAWTSVFKSGAVDAVVAEAKQGENSLFKRAVAGLKDLYKQRKDLKAERVAKLDVPKFTLSIGVGGSGGASGDGGAVAVRNDGAVVTAGDQSHGILAQSVGGGGGGGGAGFTSGQNLLQANLSIGGSGGGGGGGGTVDVISTGSITTSGDAAFGILAQSVGGGGGIGGVAQNQQTIGARLSLNIGGSNERFSPGGAVTVTVPGTVSTSGPEAHGIVAQSIGGGGGLVTVEQAGAPSATPTSPELAEIEALAASMVAATAGVDDPAVLTGTTGDSFLPSPSIGLSLGGTGGGGGDGGSVTVNLSGSITTTGDNAFGILAQSVGGGGGMGASTRAAGLAQLDFTGGIGGSGGAGGRGGDVTLTLGGTSSPPGGTVSIRTTGVGSSAVVLQSIGGGGGYGGNFSRSIWRSSGTFKTADALQGTAGNGGTITVQMADPSSRLAITTTGENAHGIVAQSIGGGGGLASDDKGLIIATTTTQATPSRANPTNAVGGAITVNTAGTISATGAGSMGIYAQSGFMRTDGTADPNVLSGSITITHQGDIKGGSGAGAAIRIDGGGQNTIILSGGSVGALSGNAVIGSFGNERLFNGGTLTGNVLLDGGRAGEINAFSNQPGATFIAGTQISLGSAGAMVNAGTMALGKLKTYDTVTLTGRFSQLASGTLIVHADFNGRRSNVLAVSGTADLAGTVRVDLVNPAPSPGLTILTAAGGVTSTATASTGLLIYSYDISPQQNAIRLNLSANFMPATATLSANQRTIASSLQSEWAAGGYDPKYLAFTKVLSLGAYYRALNQLSPEGSFVPAANKAQGAQTFMNNLMSCPDFAGSDTDLVERDCTWLRTVGGWTSQDASAGSTGYKSSSVTYQLGGQKNLGSGWILGASASYGITTSAGDGGSARSNGESVDVGTALKYQTGLWLFSGALSGGYGWYANRRQISFDDSGSTARSSSRLESIALRLRAARQFPMGPVYVRPYVDVDTVYTRTPSYRETNADMYNLQVLSSDQVTVLGSPMLEFGGRIDPGSGVALRPFVAAGITIRSDDGIQTSSRFLAGSDQASRFVSRTNFPQAYGNFITGLDVLHVSGLEVKGQYVAKAAAGFLSQEAMFRLGYRF